MGSGFYFTLNFNQLVKIINIKNNIKIILLFAMREYLHNKNVIVSIFLSIKLFFFFSFSSYNRKRRITG